MYDLLWLLLPVAAASGWLLARKSPARGVQTPGLGMRQAYFKGLNYLLNEQPDKAIEVFIKLLEEDSETVETHLALGNLFRRRGEVDRAIRIHQNLIARPSLDRSQRSQALLELGQDYMRAGLLDRAESIFQELIGMRMHADAARRHLQDIYQLEKDWENAISVTRASTALPEGERRLLIGQFYCELAEEALASGDRRAAQQMIRRALTSDAHCVRASLIAGDLEAGSGNWKAAIEFYRRVEDQNLDYLPEVIAPLKECYKNLGDRAGYIAYLHKLQLRYQGISVLLAMAEVIRDTEGEAQATAYLVERLRQKPSVRGLDWLLRTKLSNADERARGNLDVLKQITHALLEHKPSYKCTRCGFSAKALHWHCPSCRSWSSIRQIQGVEGE